MVRTLSSPSLPSSARSISTRESARIRASFSRIATRMCRRVATGRRAARSRRSALGAWRAGSGPAASVGRAALSPGSGTTTRSSGRGRRGGRCGPAVMALAPIQGPKPLAPQANATLQAAQNRSGPFAQNGISVRRPKVTDKPARGTDGPMPITKRTVNLEAGVSRGVVSKSPKPLGRAGRGPGFVARELPWCGARVARMRGHPSMPRATGSRPVRSAGLVPCTACVLEHTARGVVQEVTVLAHKGA